MRSADVPTVRVRDSAVVVRSASAEEASAEDTIASKDIARVTLEHVAGCTHWYLQHREGWTLHFNDEFGGAADVSTWLERSLGFRKPAQIAGPGGQGTVAWSRP